MPAPVGTHDVRVSYSGCREAVDEVVSVEVVEAARTAVALDESGVVAGAPSPDEAVTLESIQYEIETFRNPDS